MKTLKITSHHHSLASAVAEAKPDLSYNEEVAKRDIRDVDLNCTQAVVVEGGDIYFVFNADIQVLNKFTPFISVLSEGNFSVASIKGDTLSISSPVIPKTSAGRKLFRSFGNGVLAA